MTGYHPGVCNIGARQRRRRAWTALGAFLVAGALVAAYLLGLFSSPLLLLSVFVPLTLGCEWAIQAYEAFCVRLALFGHYDFTADGGGTTGTVADAEDRQADQLYAVKITVVSVGVGAVATLVIAASLL